jgi:hypothetical protein
LIHWPFGASCGVTQIDLRQRQSAVDEMNVIIDEARHHERAFQIDGASLRVCELTEIRRAAHGDDIAVIDGNRLRLGLLAVARPYIRIEINGVGRC